MKIESSNYIYVEETSNCTNSEAFYECFAKKLITLADFNHCPKKCLPSNLASPFSRYKSQISMLKIYTVTRMNTYYSCNLLNCIIV